MLRATRRRIGAPAWLALGLVVGLPLAAEAQLFPNRTIKRQREACVNEPPFNAHVRRDYYGYYPTCWSRFPAGWGCPCPNPELPDAAASFRNRPLDPIRPDALNGAEPGTDDAAPAMNPDTPAVDPNMPEVPRGRSPFNLDDRPDPGTAPANPNPNPAPNPRIPGTGRPGPRSGDNPTLNPAGRNPGATSLLEMPSVPSPTIVAESHLEPGALALAPDAALASISPSTPAASAASPATDRPDLGPLSSAPLPAGSTPDSNLADRPMLGTPAPAQAPQRRSLLGGLFGSSTKRRR